VNGRLIIDESGGAREALVLLFSDDDEVASIAVVPRRDGETVVEGELRPRWHSTYPNGEACGPECRVADLDGLPVVDT
jgi:hypothetical protein